MNPDSIPGVLPSVQIVRAVEEIFGIEIQDCEAQPISTVGQLRDLVLSKCAGRISQGCFGATAFYCLRKALVAGCNVSRNSVTPDKEMSALLPMRTRKQSWQSLARTLELPLPTLRFSPTVENILAWATLLSFLGLIIASLFKFFWMGVVALAILVAAVVFLSTRSFNPLAVHFPSNLKTVGLVAEQLAVWNLAYFYKRNGTWNEAESAEAVRIIVAQICSATPDEVQWETKFTELPDFE